MPSSAQLYLFASFWLVGMLGLTENIVSLALRSRMGFKKKKAEKAFSRKVPDWKTMENKLWSSADVKLLKINSNSCGQIKFRLEKNVGGK